jgi:hypothetical protein
MRDIADLARVRRPVVSMWRNRPTVRGRLLPFPEPLEVAGGVERFSRDDIVDWLERTGRGNNEEARLDAPALSMPVGTSLERLVTLLCLRTCTGEELAESTERERDLLARGVDPRDEFMVNELRAVKATKEQLRYIDDLVEASYGPAEALARLESGSTGRAIGVRDLTTGALDLLRTVSKACGDHLDPEGVPLVHTGSSAMLTLALAGDFAHLVVAPGDAEHRGLRRRAAIQGIEMSAASAGPSVRVLSVVGLDSADALDALDDVVVDLDHGDIAVAVGPASLLCDELRGAQERERAQTLRQGNLAMALRLPRGMWREAYRQALGIWICVGGRSAPRPLVADLGALLRHEMDLGDLAADVTGALAHGEARSFRYARPHELRMILSDQAVVPRGVRSIPIRTSDADSALERIHAATLATAEPLSGFDVLAEAAPGSRVVRRRSLSELKNERHVSVRRGSRIDPTHADPLGTVAVLCADSDAEGFKLDPFDALRLYPRAVRTEPGDVVFVDRPRPRALVDARGGSLVASPSKILRLSPTAGIGPNAAAAIINHLPAEVDEWQAWSLPILDRAEADQLDKVITAAAEHEASVRQRLDAVRNLVTVMINGVADGAVTLRTDEEK